jgi:hypothetical protein
VVDFQPTEQAQSENPGTFQPINVWRVYAQFTDEERAKILADDPATIAELIAFMKATLQ